MLIDRKTFALHRSWLVVVIVGTVIAAGFDLFWARGSSFWPGGSSLPGMVFGVSAGGIIVFEFLLWPKKQLRWLRIGSARSWLRAHIWLGLFAVPLVVLHSGLNWTGRGSLTAVLMALFWITIVSGIFGLAMQQWLPRLLLNTVPAETIYSQIEHVARQYADDAEALVRATCGPAKGSSAHAGGLPELSRSDDVDAHIVIGAVRAAGKMQGRVLQTAARPLAVANSERLRVIFDSQIRPFLDRGSQASPPLSDPLKATALFRDLKAGLDPAAHSAVDALETWCNHRRQFDRQARIHWWLHSWLSIHLPCSFALVLLLVVHVVVALKYW